MNINGEPTEPVTTQKTVGPALLVEKRRRVSVKGGRGVPSTLDLQPLGQHTDDTNNKAATGLTNTSDAKGGGVVMPEIKTPASGRPLTLWLGGLFGMGVKIKHVISENW